MVLDSIARGGVCVWFVLLFTRNTRGVAVACACLRGEKQKREGTHARTTTRTRPWFSSMSTVPTNRVTGHLTLIARSCRLDSGSNSNVPTSIDSGSNVAVAHACYRPVGVGSNQIKAGVPVRSRSIRWSGLLCCGPFFVVDGCRACEGGTCTACCILISKKSFGPY